MLGLAGAMALASGGLIAGHYVLDGRGNSAASEASKPQAATETGVKHVDGLADLLTHDVDVDIAGDHAQVRWADLGAELDPSDPATGTAASLAARGSLPFKIDRDKAVAALMKLKGQHDRAPTDAFLDLEARAIHPDAPGTGIDVYASLSRIAAGARSGAPSIALVTVALPARVTKNDLGIDDISHVLGTYTTKFSVADKERNFNLKVAASHLNGYVLKPGVEFSFNDVVGERTEKQGYKVAHVITAGEMVDGLAGGTCQISTTLFAASFFSGLDIVKQTPHSRPSVYATLGLDATVVYPTTDLKLRNSYDFPVAIHYRVARGEAMVEILGHERPYDKITFDTSVTEDTPFTSEERQDPDLLAGSKMFDQPGFDGYKLVRTRHFMKGGEVVKTDKWPLEYKPVTEYVRVGTSTDPKAKPPKEKEIHTPPIPQDHAHLEQ